MRTEARAEEFDGEPRLAATVKARALVGDLPMRKRRYLLVLVPVALATNCARLELRDTPLPASVRSAAEFAGFLDGAVPRWMARDRVPGLCIGTVFENERILRCYGSTNADMQRPVDGRSRFGVASVSKTFASLAVLTLAGAGSFRLDDPVESRLRSWRFPASEFDGSTVTIRQLLTHTGGVGVPSYGGASTPAAGETTRDVLDGRGPGRQPVRLIAPPGSTFRYSGGGYVVLQQLVEDTSGVPFDRFVSERVFRPLGMGESTFSWGPGHHGDTAGHDVGGRPLARRVYGAAMAPGAMVTTGNDMMRFVVAFSESKLPTLLGLPGRLWDELVAPDHPGYGMAVVVGRTNGHLLVGHSGTTMGYNAGFTALPLERAGWFVLENGNGGPYLKAEIDRAFVAWRTGTIEPRHRVMQILRAVVAFFGALLAGLGILQLAFFVSTWASGCRLAPISTRGLGGLRMAVRLVTAAGLATLVVAWFVFFHTDTFYPAFTTAWLPHPFRFVTLGVALLALRGSLACVFVRRQAGAPAASGERAVS